MRDLPPEMLSYVFRDVMGFGYRDDYNSIMIPLCLSQVSRRWRYAALGFGEMWSYLTIEYHGAKHLGDQQTKYTKAILDMFYTWFQRTNGGPINFSFSCECIASGRVDDRSLIAVEGMVNTLLLRQDRWRDVYFKWNFFPSSNFRGVAATYMPNLLSLTLYWGNFPLDVGLVDYAQIDLSHSPNLRRINLCGRFTLEAGSAPMKALTDSGGLLFVADPANRHVVHESWNLLKVSPNLRCLALEYSDPEDEAFPQMYDVQPLVMPQLRELSLGLDDTSAIVLDKLTLPGLRALDYVGEGFSDDGAGIAFSNFIRRSMPPLRSLIAVGGCTNEDVLIPALRLLPALEVLSISGGTASVRLFEALTMPDRGSGALEFRIARRTLVCPALRTFDIESILEGEQEILMSAFHTMMMSRWKLNRSFTQVTIDSDTIDLPITPGSRDYQHIELNLVEETEIAVYGNTGWYEPMFTPEWWQQT